MGNTFVEQIVSQLDHLQTASDPQLDFNNAINLIEQTLNQFYVSDSKDPKINHMFQFKSITDKLFWTFNYISTIILRFFSSEMSNELINQARLLAD